MGFLRTIISRPGSKRAMANRCTTFSSIRLGIRQLYIRRRSLGRLCRSHRARRRELQSGRATALRVGLRRSRRRRRRERRSGRATALRMGRRTNLRTKCLRRFKSLAKIYVLSTFHGLYSDICKKPLQPLLNHLFEHSL